MLASWPSLFVNLVISNLRNPEWMTATSVPDRSQVTAASHCDMAPAHPSPMFQPYQGFSVGQCCTSLPCNLKKCSVGNFANFSCEIQWHLWYCPQDWALQLTLSSCKQSMFLSTNMHAYTNGFRLYLPQSAFFHSVLCFQYLYMPVNAELFIFV